MFISYFFKRPIDPSYNSKQTKLLIHEISIGNSEIIAKMSVTNRKFHEIDKEFILGKKYPNLQKNRRQLLQDRKIELIILGVETLLNLVI